MSSKITIHDIAQAAGVSIGTVSRVLNNKGYISDEVRAKVLSAVKQYQYVPSGSVQNALGNKVRTVGLIVPEIDNPFLSFMVSAIEERLSQEKYSMMLCNSRYDIVKAKAFVQQMIQLNVCHLIVLAMSFNDPAFQTVLNRHMRIVGINTTMEGADLINCTDWQASFELTEQLITIGHRDIAFMGYDRSSPPTIERLRGYKDAMMKNNLPVPAEYLLSAGFFRGNKNSDHIMQAPNMLAAHLLDLPKPPTAIMAVNDYYALGVYAEASKRGLAVGKDISVVGYDDIPLATIITPKLTTVHSDIDAIARLAISAILNRLSGSETSKEPLNIMVPCNIQSRQSVGMPSRTVTP